MIDMMKGLIAYLEADANVTGVTSRIYGGELPRSQADFMQRKAIVLRNSGSPGGPGADSFLELAEFRIDVFCYGETPFDASTVGNAVYTSLKDLSRNVVSSVLLHRANHSGGPVSDRDPDTDWPFVFYSFDVLAAEVAA